MARFLIEACHRFFYGGKTMAWRITEHLIEGELDNTHLGRVTGWMRFAGMKEKVTLSLKGDFHRDIRGAKVHFVGDASEFSDNHKAQNAMKDFCAQQTGKVGDITAGRQPVDFVGYPYFEWYSEENGRVVLELEPVQVEVIGTPIPAMESFPISRQQQADNMAEFMGKLATEMNVPKERAICVSGKSVVQACKRTVNNQRRGMKLMPEELRQKIPALYEQDGKGGKCMAYAKYFCPSSSWTWWACEYDGEDTFFGLVDGHCKELGYFGLAELEEVTGPMGLPIERDLGFKPTTLQEIAPELFTEEDKGGESL